jgi:hypothetical protein
MNFLTPEILTKLRNRTYFQEYRVTGDVIKSEGAWRLTFQNEGDEDVFIIDGSGQKKILSTTRPFFVPSSPFYYIADGAPYITRDDEFTIEFAGGGLDPLLTVAFDRLVTKKETNDYPLDNLLNQLKK